MVVLYERGAEPYGQMALASSPTTHPIQLPRFHHLPLNRKLFDRICRSVCLSAGPLPCLNPVQEDRKKDGLVQQFFMHNGFAHSAPLPPARVFSLDWYKAEKNRGDGEECVVNQTTLCTNWSPANRDSQGPPQTALISE